MALSYVRELCSSLLICSLLGSACRTTSLCESVECVGDSSPAPQSSGGMDDGGRGGAASGNPGRAGEAAIHAGGADGGASAGGSPTETPDEPLECDAGLANCDGSSFTGCEAELAWHHRSCGDCGIACQGGCFGGKCLPTALLARWVIARDIALTTTHAFATLYDDEQMTLVKIERKSGSDVSVLTREHERTDLVLGADRVYLYQAESLDAWSVPIDGATAEHEELEAPQSLGASNFGVYYVSGSYDEITEVETYELRFRPTGQTSWSALASGRSGAIVGSASEGIVFATEDEGVTQLYVVEGDDVIEYGSVSGSVVEAIFVDDEVAALVPNDDDGQFHLWWLGLDEAPRHYAVGDPTGDQSRYLHATATGVLLFYEDPAGAYAQFFGDSSQRVGLPNASVVASALEGEIWFSVWDDWYERRFLRSTYFNTTP